MFSSKLRRLWLAVKQWIAGTVTLRTFVDRFQPLDPGGNSLFDHRVIMLARWYFDVSAIDAESFHALLCFP